MSGNDIINNKSPQSQSQVSTNQFLEDYLNDQSVLLFLPQFDQNKHSDIQYSCDASILSNQTEKYEAMIRPAIDKIVQKINRLISYNFLKRLKIYFNKSHGLKVLIKFNLMVSVKTKNILDSAFFQIKQFAKDKKAQISAENPNQRYNKPFSIPKQNLLRLVQCYSVLQVKVINRFHIIQAFKIIKKKYERNKSIRAFTILLQRIFQQKLNTDYRAIDFFQKLNQIQVTKDKLDILVFTINPLFERVKNQAFAKMAQLACPNTSLSQQIKQVGWIESKIDEKIFMLTKSFHSETILAPDRKDYNENHMIKKETEYYVHNNSSKKFQIVRTVDQKQFSCKSEPNQYNQTRKLQFSQFKRKKNLIEEVRAFRASHKSCSQTDNGNNKETYCDKDFIHQKEERRANSIKNKSLRRQTMERQNKHISNQNIYLNPRKQRTSCVAPLNLNLQIVKSGLVGLNCENRPLPLRISQMNTSSNEIPLKMHHRQPDALKRDNQDVGETFSLKLIEFDKINCKNNTPVYQIKKILPNLHPQRNQPIFQVQKPIFNQIQLPRYISLQKIMPFQRTNSLYSRQVQVPRSVSSKKYSFKQYLQQRKNQGISPKRTAEKKMRVTMNERQAHRHQKQEVHNAYYPGFSKNYYISQKTIQRPFQRQRGNKNEGRSKSPQVLSNIHDLQKNWCQFNPKYSQKKAVSPAKNSYHGQYFQSNPYRSQSNKYL